MLQRRYCSSLFFRKSDFKATDGECGQNSFRQFILRSTVYVQLSAGSVCILQFMKTIREFHVK